MNLGDRVSGAAHLCGPATTLREAVVAGLDLVGLITERDLRRASAVSVDFDTTAVRDVMSKDPDTFDPDLDVWDAAAWISESGYRHLPVMDDSGELLGVVSIRDLLRALVETV